jgi:HK97 family phage major capsid protein
MEPEFKELVDKVQQSFSELQQRQKVYEERHVKTCKMLGIDPEKLDGEEKHNLKSLANIVADQEAVIEQLRRARVQGPAQVAPGQLIDAKSGQPVQFKRPLDRARNFAAGSDEYGDAFERALHKGLGGVADNERRYLEFKDSPKSVERQIAAELAREGKASGLSTDFEPAGGMFAPPTMESQITKRVIELSPFEQLVRVVTVGTGSYEGVLRTANRDTIQKVGERQTPTQATQLKRYEKRRIEVHEFAVWPAITATMAEDSEIDLGSELAADCGEDFAVLRGYHFLKGSGVDEPEGFLQSTEVATKNSGSAATFTMDSIKLLPQQLKVEYKLAGSYILSRDALTTLMLFRDNSGGVAGTGSYLWEPSTQAGTPSRLNGFGWREMVDMDAVAANTYPVAFGDFARAYRVVERRGIRIVRDELTTPPFIIFRMSRRYGGRVWMGEAAVKMKCAA